MAILPVSGAHTVQAPGDTVFTTGITTTGSNAFVVGVVYSGAGAAPTITDTYSNTWVLGVTKTAADGSLAMFTAINATSGTGHQFKSSGQSFPAIIVQGFSGVASASALDLTSGIHNTGSGATSIQPGSITPYTSNELFVTFFEAYTANTASIACADGANTFTITDKRTYPGGSAALGCALAYFVNTGTGALNPTWSGFSSTLYIGAGMIVLSPTAIVFPTITYSLAASGDLTSIATSGPCTATPPVWSGGTVTVTTDAPHGITSGSLFTTSVSAPGNTAWTGSIISSDYTATATGASTFTYPLAGNPGTAPSAPSGMFFSSHDVNTFLGSALGTPDATFYSRGSTCPGNAPDSSHIVVQSSDSAHILIGHAIIANSTTCLAIGQNGSTIAVGAIGQINGTASPANFGTTLSSGASYRIDPTAAWIFNVGTTTGGSRVWHLTGYNHNGSALMNIGPYTLSATNIVKFQGIFPYNQSVPLGTPLDNSSAVVINHGPPPLPNNNQDHTTLLGLNSGFVYFDMIQFNVDKDVFESDGVLKTASLSDPINFSNFVFRNDAGESTRAHVPWGDNTANFLFSNGLFVNTNTYPKAGITANGHTITSKFCGYMNTQNAQTTVSATVSSGTTITVASNAGIVAGYSYVQTLNNGSITAGAIVGTVTGTVAPYTVVLTTGSVVGTITAGTTLTFGALRYAMQTPGSGSQAFTATNTGIFGIPEVEVPSGANFTTTLTACVADSNPQALPGLSIVNYTSAIMSGSGLGNTGTIDARVPVGSGLRGAGTPDATVPLDIFGQIRPNPPSPWPAEFINSGNVARGLIGGGIGGAII